MLERGRDHARVHRVLAVTNWNQQVLHGVREVGNLLLLDDPCRPLERVCLAQEFGD